MEAPIPDEITDDDIQPVLEVLEQDFNSIFEPYLSKIDDALLVDLCGLLYGVGMFASMGEKEKSGQKSCLNGLLKDSLWSACIPQRAHASKQKKKLEIISNLLSSLIENLEELGCNRKSIPHPSNSEQYRVCEMARKELEGTMINRTQKDGGYHQIYPPTTVRIDSKTEHTFCGEDIRFARFMEDLQWVSDCTVSAVEGITGGRPFYNFTESLIIPLANVYYLATTEVPYAQYSGSDGIVKGKVAGFIAKILNAFECTRSDRWVAEQLNAQIAESKYFTRPLWGNEQG